MQRFRRPQDQRRYGISRATLRYLLGAYLQRPAATLEFGYGPYGKPYLIGSLAQPLEFNLSHSEDWALLAFGPAPLGIDLEVVRPLKRLAGLVQACLTETEQTNLQTLTDEAAARQFFRYWTCKEAYLKAIGQGHRQPMQSISLDFNQAVPHAQDPQLSRLALDDAWQILTWSPQAELLAALVISTQVGREDFQIQRHPLAPEWLLALTDG